MANENRRTAHSSKRASDRCCIVRDGVELILRGKHLIPVRDEQLHDLAIARAVGPETMSEHDAWFIGHTTPPKGPGWGRTGRPPDCSTEVLRRTLYARNATLLGGVPISPWSVGVQ